MFLRSLAVCAMALGLMTGIAFDAMADPKEDAISARRGYYQMVKFNAGTIIAMVKGNVEYNADAAQKAANNLKTLTMLERGAMWPKGSSKEEMPGKTRALKKIWDTFPAIGEKGKAFGEAVDGLVAVAGQGLDKVRPAVGKLGGTCKACHEEYRAKDF